MIKQEQSAMQWRQKVKDKLVLVKDVTNSELTEIVHCLDGGDKEPIEMDSFIIEGDKITQVGGDMSGIK